MDMIEKNYAEKTPAQDIFDRIWNLDGGKDTGQNYQCEIFNFADLCSGVALCGRLVDHTPNTSQWFHCCHFLC